MTIYARYILTAKCNALRFNHAILHNTIQDTIKMTDTQVLNSLITLGGLILLLTGLLCLAFGLYNTGGMACGFSLFAFVYLYIFD
jgi:hypothetical protein